MSRHPPAAHPSQTPRRFSRLPPGGGAIDWKVAWAAFRGRDPDRGLREGLCRLVGAQAVTLHASGREALRVALSRLADRSGRSEIVVPAYTCYSIPAAAVAAGLQVRLVDVTMRGQIDRSALEKLPLERAAAVVVSNLLGVPESTHSLRGLLQAAGVALVDDAAQALGAMTPDGPVGGRGDVGLMSFGRGKPLSALGGGALAWARRSDAGEDPERTRPRRAMALARAAAYDLALVPWVFRILSTVPALGIGETVYDPGFSQGAIDGASLCLAAAQRLALDSNTQDRGARAARLASRLREATRFRALLADEGSGAYPRLGVIAPNPRARDAALSALSSLGATRLYPSPLDQLEALRPHRVGDIGFPGAHEFAARLLTFPTHAGLRTHHLDEIVRALECFD